MAFAARDVVLRGTSSSSLPAVMSQLRGAMRLYSKGEVRQWELKAEGESRLKRLLTGVATRKLATTGIQHAPRMTAGTLRTVYAAFAHWPLWPRCGWSHRHSVGKAGFRSPKPSSKSRKRAFDSRIDRTYILRRGQPCLDAASALREAYAPRMGITPSSGPTPVLMQLDSAGAVTAAPLTRARYLENLRRRLSPTEDTNLKALASRNVYHRMRSGGYSDAVNAGMPDNLAAFLGTWSLGKARQQYYKANDDEVAHAVMQYLL